MSPGPPTPRSITCLQRPLSLLHDYNSVTCATVYIELLKATAAVSPSTSSPASSSSMKDSFLPCVGLHDECSGHNEDDDEERRTFKKECQATDALVQIGGMLLDVVQILRDCHEMRQRHIYGRSAALVRSSPKPNAKRKLTF